MLDKYIFYYFLIFLRYKIVLNTGTAAAITFSVLKIINIKCLQLRDHIMTLLRIPKQYDSVHQETFDQIIFLKTAFV